MACYFYFERVLSLSLKLTFMTVFRKPTKKSLLILGLATALSVVLYNGLGVGAHQSVDYNEDVKPILNRRCIHCHGGVRQNGGLAMMTREDLLRPAESGKAAVVPGHPGRSELIRRIKSTDESERMPLEGHALPKTEIATLERWIRQGAEWGLHWAYRPVEKPVVPAVKLAGMAPGAEWAVADIDRFIIRQLKSKQLQPSRQAPKAILLRRVSLDLTGLPAPDSIARQYLEDDSDAAYANLVESLLRLPSFGERWAAMWMDLARYADTKGFERDANRTIWPYRDWLIRAFNEDKPYDDFLIEQLAGDLLPEPTLAQYIATGFHRNTKTNDEGGSDNEEFRVAAVLDRVNTTWEVLMGTTFACTQCHGHPYDPFEHEDYYKFVAFFNNTRDEDTAEDYPWLRMFGEEQEQELQLLDQWLAQKVSTRKAREMTTFLRTWQPVYYSIATDSFVNAALYDTKHLNLRNYSSARLAGVDLSGIDHLIYRFRSQKAGGRLQIHLGSVDGPVIGSARIGQPAGWQFGEIPLKKMAEGKHDLYFTYTNPNLAKAGAAGIAFDWFYFTQPFPGKGQPGYDEQKARFRRLMESSPRRTLIMMDNPLNRQRVTKVFDRGNWQVGKQEVTPGVPEVFPPLPEDGPANRLGMAHWLVASDHPLTSRTMVNRVWEQLFGQGLALTLEDLGTQGVPPTHPELLDYLSHQFMHEYDWSIKTLLKNILLSSVYRQSSEATAEQLEKDPLNQYYARMPRVRLSAEQLRDQTLSVSGLLSGKMYGPGVMPHQPEGVWSTAYNNSVWTLSSGQDKYRRALYTFWKRSAPYPAMTTFDASAREVCLSRRIRTNTPLQALVTLNDQPFMEAAQALASKVIQQEKDTHAAIAKAYRAAIGYEAAPGQLAALQQLYAVSRRHYQEDEADLLAAVPETMEGQDRVQLAAMTLVTNAIFNLDEFLVKG